MSATRRHLLTISALIGASCAEQPSHGPIIEALQTYCDRTAVAARQAQAASSAIQDFLRQPAADERQARHLAERLSALDLDCGAELLAELPTRRLKTAVKQDLVEITIACERARFAAELLSAELHELRTGYDAQGSCTVLERARQAARRLDGALTARQTGLRDTIATKTDEIRERVTPTP